MKSFFFLIAILSSGISVSKLVDSSKDVTNWVFKKDSIASNCSKVSTNDMVEISSFNTSPNVTICNLDYASYDESTWYDASFEGKAELHSYELKQLNTYFVEQAPVPKQFLSNCANFLTTDFLADVLAEYLYIQSQTTLANCESIRLCSNEVAALSTSERQAYLSRLTFIKDHYSFTAVQLEYIRSEISSVLPLASPSLRYSLTLLLDYLDLVENLRYSKLEVFRDFTGYCNPTEYIAMAVLNDASDYPLAFQRSQQGLAAKEAIKRLQMLEADEPMPQLANKGVDSPGVLKGEIANNIPFVVCKLDAYPNPVKSNESINVKLQAAMDISNVSIKILDLNGKEIKTLAKSEILPKNSYNFIWDGENSSGEKVQSGIYYCLLTSDQTAKITSKIIILN